ncbi:MAG: Rab family GTPase [Candidatus Hodarchaeales archaeon]|jgi:GTPase SAR1 family protein
MSSDNEYLLKISISGKNTELNKKFGRITADNVFDRDDLPTLGVDIPTKIITIEALRVKLIIMITAGEENFRQNRPGFYRGASAGIFLFGKDDREAYHKVKGFHKEFKEKITKQVPIAIVGITTESEEVTREEGELLAKKLEGQYFETQITDKTLIDQIFHILAKQVTEY